MKLLRNMANTLLIFFSLIHFSLQLKNEVFVDHITNSQTTGLENLQTYFSIYGIGKYRIPSDDDVPSIPKNLHQNCYDIMNNGNRTSGIYWIKPNNATPFRVLCDMDIWGGGWTYIQKRYDGSQEFFNGWRDYKHGFGYLNREHWLGLESIYALTGHTPSELLIEITDHDGVAAYAHYDYFQIGSELQGYHLSVLSGYKGDAGDSLVPEHVGMKFSTYDFDQDIAPDLNCAENYLGAWWYSKCHWSNLNAKYINVNLPKAYWYKGVQWNSFRSGEYCHSKVRMLVRPAIH